MSSNRTMAWHRTEAGPGAESRAEPGLFPLFLAEPLRSIFRLSAEHVFCIRLCHLGHGVWGLVLGRVVPGAGLLGGPVVGGASLGLRGQLQHHLAEPLPLTQSGRVVVMMGSTGSNCAMLAADHRGRRGGWTWARPRAGAVGGTRLPPPRLIVADVKQPARDTPASKKETCDCEAEAAPAAELSRLPSPSPPPPLAWQRPAFARQGDPCHFPPPTPPPPLPAAF